jgi:cytochrome c biogenesis protein CcmG/thiol:disulfide interchange protein DsbE
LARDGARLIGVASMDDGPRARSFLDSHGDPFMRTALDARGALLRGFGFRGVPGFVIVGTDGAPRVKHEGPLDDRFVATRLLPALHAG